MTKTISQTTKLWRTTIPHRCSYSYAS